MTGNDFPSASYDQWKLAGPNEADDALVEWSDRIDDALDAMQLCINTARGEVNTSDPDAVYATLTDLHSLLSRAMTYTSRMME